MTNIEILLLTAKQDEIQELIDKVEPVYNQLKLMKKETAKRIRLLQDGEKYKRLEERLARAKIIYEHRSAGMTYEAIGAEFRITKQRARQIYFWYKKQKDIK